MKLFSSPSEQKSMNLCNTVCGLSRGNLVYSVEKSNVFIDLARTPRVQLINCFQYWFITLCTQKLLALAKSLYLLL